MRLINIYKSVIIERLLKEAPKLSDRDSKAFKLAIAKVVNQYWPSGLSVEDLIDVVKSNFPNGFKNPNYASFYDDGETLDSEPVPSPEEKQATPDEIPATIEDMVDVYLKSQFSDKNPKFVEVTKSEFNKNHLNVTRTKSKITKYWTLVYRLDESGKIVYYYVDKVVSPNKGVAYLYMHKGQTLLGNRHEVVKQ